MYAIRYEATKREVGEYLDDSRVWVDGTPTDETLDGTSCLIISQDKDTGHQYAAIFPNRYLVEGNWVADGEDAGEVVLSDCKVIEDLVANPEEIEYYK